MKDSYIERLNGLTKDELRLENVENMNDLMAIELHEDRGVALGCAYDSVFELMHRDVGQEESQSLFHTMCLLAMMKP